MKINAFIIKSNVLTEKLRLFPFFGQMLYSVKTNDLLTIFYCFLRKTSFLSGKQTTFTRYYVKKDSLFITGNILGFFGSKSHNIPIVFSVSFTLLKKFHHNNCEENKMY